MISSKELYTKVNRLRLEKGLSLNKLSELAGISHGTLNSWKNRGTMPKHEVIEGICYALDISPIVLLYGEDFAELTSDEIELLNLWREVNHPNKKMIIELLKVIIKGINGSSN